MLNFLSSLWVKLQKAISPTPPIMQLYVLVTGPHSAASITLRIFFYYKPNLSSVLQFNVSYFINFFLFHHFIQWHKCCFSLLSTVPRLSLEQKCLNVFKIASINTFIFYSVSDNFMLGERVHTGQTHKELPSDSRCFGLYAQQLTCFGCMVMKWSRWCHQSVKIKYINQQNPLSTRK